MRRWSVKKTALLCYFAVVALWIVRGFFFFGYDRLFTESKEITIQPQMLQGIVQTETESYLTETDDPQIILSGINANVRQVVLYAGFGQEPGEMDLYYNKTAGNGFSPRYRAFGKPQEDGSYVYALFPTKAGDIRIDPGNQAGQQLQLYGVTLNPRLPLSTYFSLNLYTVAVLALVPALAVCAIYTIIELWQFAAQKLRKSRK